MTSRSNKDWLLWARLRLSIIGRLLASPPQRGELQTELRELSRQIWCHPTQPDERLKFGLSTLERWYYRARNADDPLDALARCIRKDAGCNRAMSTELFRALEQQYQQHRDWSWQLHHDNLKVLSKQNTCLGPMPSYSTIRRRMRDQDMYPKKRPRTKGQQQALERFEKKEVRGFEASHVHGLWHLDFHEGSLRVIDAQGRYHKPILLGLLDDRSRLCCHAQWYLAETAENLVHGTIQAFLKRGLCRALMSDNGGAMLSAEFRNGLARLGVEHNTTLSNSPYQNGKQEAFWGPVEGRLLKMLNRVKPLELAFLNKATQAWYEMEYNRSSHSEIKCTPLSRYLEGPQVGRQAPYLEAQQLAFCSRQSRLQRKSDGTISLNGVRFEIPSRYRTLIRVWVRYRTWDLSSIWLMDERDRLLCRIFPQDKVKNADGIRRLREPLTGQVEHNQQIDNQDVPLPPLMQQLLSDYAATGLPPAYIAKNEEQEKKEDE